MAAQDVRLSALILVTGCHVGPADVYGSMRKVEREVIIDTALGNTPLLCLTSFLRLNIDLERVVAVFMFSFCRLMARERTQGNIHSCFRLVIQSALLVSCLHISYFL